jgi:hypothetical protein
MVKMRTVGKEMGPAIADEQIAYRLSRRSG